MGHSCWHATMVCRHRPDTSPAGKTSLGPSKLQETGLPHMDMPVQLPALTRRRESMTSCSVSALCSTNSSSTSRYLLIRLLAMRWE